MFGKIVKQGKMAELLFDVFQVHPVVPSLAEPCKLALTGVEFRGLAPDVFEPGVDVVAVHDQPSVMFGVTPDFVQLRVFFLKCGNENGNLLFASVAQVDFVFSG